MIEKNEITLPVNELLLTRENLTEQFIRVRNFTELLAAPLETEDFVIQSMPDVSPSKWHMAHTSWFFEAMILSRADGDYKSLHPQYNFLFNSYYVLVGKRHTRAHRGLLSRPTVKEVYAYRKYVNEKMLDFINNSSDEVFNEYAPVIEIGIHHEQQHQELFVTDIKHVFSVNPLRPVYFNSQPVYSNLLKALSWAEYEEGIYELGFKGNGFSYDNESPRHKEYIHPWKLANRLITNSEYLEFMEDGAYIRPELWLSDGWASAESNKWEAPLYWEKEGNDWWNFTLSGYRIVNMNEPVCHVSFYEADAFARWKGLRLPTESEWETASAGLSLTGNFVEKENYHPVPFQETNGRSNHLLQMFGDVWEWTESAYRPYSGYKTLPGALGEYNGKFMSGQMVLRGGSCATSETHIRNTYRNFFPPDSRWQFMGIRLAETL